MISIKINNGVPTISIDKGTVSIKELAIVTAMLKRGHLAEGLHQEIKKICTEEQWRTYIMMISNIFKTNDLPIDLEEAKTPAVSQDPTLEEAD